MCPGRIDGYELSTEREPAGPDNLLSALKQQTTDNAAQQIRVKTLQEMSAVRLAILKQGIDLRRRIADEATAFIVASKDKAQMDAIRQHVKEMEQVESDLLKNRENDSDTAYRVAVLTGLLAAVLGLVTVGAFVRLLDRSLRTRQEAAAALFVR